MMTKNEILEIVIKTASQHLRDEVSEVMSWNNEIGDLANHYTVTDAIQHIEQSDMHTDLRGEIRKILIFVGFYSPVDISQVQVSSGKRYDFKMNRIHYAAKKPFSTWQSMS